MYLLVELVGNASFLGHALDILMNSGICAICVAPAMIGGEQFGPGTSHIGGTRGSLVRGAKLLYLDLVFLMRAERCSAVYHR